MAKEKSNKQFMLLSALGIFFVVDMHAGSPFGIFNSIFNYESFFMQMFVFISGYFFKEKNLQTPFKYIWKNTVKLMIPFFVINAVYTGLIMLAKLYQPQACKTLSAADNMGLSFFRAERGQGYCIHTSRMVRAYAVLCDSRIHAFKACFQKMEFCNCFLHYGGCRHCIRVSFKKRIQHNIYRSYTQNRIFHTVL